MDTANSAPIRIARTDGIAGARITRTLGVVEGTAIRSHSVSGNIMARVDALGIGSALDEYQDFLAAVRRDVLAPSVQVPLGPGANAVIGMRFYTAKVGRETTEIVACGTAVVLQDS